MVVFSSFLVKVASRCNLACDYCYMYEHADQSWRTQPHVMSESTEDTLATRLGEYVELRDLSEIDVLLHGGEPLLAGIPAIERLVSKIRISVRSSTHVNYSLQTNGTLLNEDALDRLGRLGVDVALSIDGPQQAHDLHRRTKLGQTSFPETIAALELLRTRPKTFSGIISVIDPRVPGAELLKFFDEYQPPGVDFLLPDAHHRRPPFLRDHDPSLYSRWLIEAFDEWFDRYPHLPVRIFDEILRGVVGLPSGTDSLGMGDVSLVVIETDGSYHDLDVLKIASENATATGLTLEKDSIDSVSRAPRIQEHDRLLKPAGLSAQCQSCPELAVCGGGSVPHRYDNDGFTHPSIYCQELLDLIGHVRERLTEQLAVESGRREPERRSTLEHDFDRADRSAPFLQNLLALWQADALDLIRSLVGTAVESEMMIVDGMTAVHPTAVIETRVAAANRRGIPTRSLDGRVLVSPANLAADLAELTRLARRGRWSVHRDDAWLRAPFGMPIVFETDPEVVRAGARMVAEAEQLIAGYSSALFEEMMLISREVQFVRDVEADPDKIVSFSDDSVPGALYVSIPRGTGPTRVFDLSDSLIHEHRHQKLYILSQTHRLVAKDFPYVVSPWREDPRPPSGLIHAVFVFAELRRFWEHVGRTLDGEVSERAAREVRTITSKLRQARTTLEGLKLTAAGERLVGELYAPHSA